MFRVISVAYPGGCPFAYPGCVQGTVTPRPIGPYPGNRRSKRRYTMTRPARMALPGKEDCGVIEEQQHLQGAGPHSRPGPPGAPSQFHNSEHLGLFQDLVEDLRGGQAPDLGLPGEEDAVPQDRRDDLLDVIGNDIRGVAEGCHCLAPPDQRDRGPRGCPECRCPGGCGWQQQGSGYTGGPAPRW